MEWSNEKSLEFLQLLQLEPCIWDPRCPAHKNRAALSDAWRRIVQALSFEVTTEELKKKKDALMGYYRIHLNKFKKSVKSGASIEDLYKTNWFAFDLMHSFLRPIYMTGSLKNSEFPGTSLEENNTEENTNDSSENRSITGVSTSTRSSINEHESTPTINRPKIEIFKRPHIQYQKSITAPEIIKAEQHMNEALDCLKSAVTKKAELDEYDHFGLMIASKIRKIHSTDDREILMNSIQNLAFDFYMKSKQLRNTSMPAQSSPIYIHQSPHSSSSSIHHSPQTDDVDLNSDSAVQPFTYIKVEHDVYDGTPQSAASTMNSRVNPNSE